MNDVSVVISCENISGTAHVCGKLINFIKATIDHRSTKVRVAEIADDKIVCRRLGMFVTFQIDSPHPKAFELEPLDQVTADKPAGSAHERLSHPCAPLLLTVRTVPPIRVGGRNSAEPLLEIVDRQDFGKPPRLPCSAAAVLKRDATKQRRRDR